MRDAFSTARVSGVSVTLNPSKVQRWVRLPADAFSFFLFFFPFPSTKFKLFI